MWKILLFICFKVFLVCLKLHVPKFVMLFIQTKKNLMYYALLIFCMNSTVCVKITIVFLKLISYFDYFDRCYWSFSFILFCYYYYYLFVCLIKHSFREVIFNQYSNVVSALRVYFHYINNQRILSYGKSIAFIYVLYLGFLKCLLCTKIIKLFVMYS